MLTPLLFTLAATAPAATTPSVPHPIACRTNALDKDQRKRQQVLLDTVRHAAIGTEDLPDGVALSFPCPHSPESHDHYRSASFCAIVCFPPTRG